MTSSSAPAGVDQLGRIAAARLHSRRFNRSLIGSLVTLAAADDLITHCDGGVLAITGLERPWPRVITTAVLYFALITAMSTALLNGLVLIGALLLIVLLVIVVFTGPKTARRARHAHLSEAGSESATWLITDVATNPHLGIGDQLMSAAAAKADVARADLVLVTRSNNITARNLYQRHGFVDEPHLNDLRLVRRIPRAPGPPCGR